ncbi:unnamed protein product [Caenorhabditis nigoni]
MLLSTVFLVFLPTVAFSYSTTFDIQHTKEAYNLMILLKDSIDLDQIDALDAFVDPKFTWDDCKKVMEYAEYVRMLKIYSSAKAMNTNWSLEDSGTHMKENVLYFTIRHNYRKLAYYPDLHFEAKPLGKNGAYILTRGKSDRCGKLEEN